MRRRVQTPVAAWGRSATAKPATVRRGLGVVLSLACLPFSGASSCASPTEAIGSDPPGAGMRSPISAILLRGSFHDVAASGSGLAEIIQAPDGTRSLHLSDFQVDRGPLLEVYMVAATDATDSQSVVDAGYVTLGALQSASGDQMYEIPADLDLDEYRAVTIWCVTFVVNFATAPLSPFGT